MSVTPPAPPSAPPSPYPPHPHQPEPPDKPCGCGCADGCGGIPELAARLRYFHGQPLGAVDLRREQSYHREKARLHNRLHHGWGFVCGVDIDDRAEQAEGRVRHRPDGRRSHRDAGRRARLPRERDRRSPPASGVRRPSARHATCSSACTKEPATVYLTLCFQEMPIDPMRPLLTGGCEPTPECEHGRILETYRICATLERPSQGPACEPCCGACDETCLELVAIRDFKPGEPLREEQLDVGGRRALALRELTEIVGINWVHGATYSRDDANALLDEGLQIWLSRRVPSRDADARGRRAHWHRVGCRSIGLDLQHRRTLRGPSPRRVHGSLHLSRAPLPRRCSTAIGCSSRFGATSSSTSAAGPWTATTSAAACPWQEIRSTARSVACPSACAHPGSPAMASRAATSCRGST